MLGCIKRTLEKSAPDWFTAAQLVAFLNGEPENYFGLVSTSDERRRILSLIEEIRLVTELAIADRRRGSSDARLTPGLLDHLNRRLSRYPSVHFFEGRRLLGGWTVQLRDPDQSASSLERSTIEDVVELAKAGALDRIRQCFCGRWFYAARVQDQRHCSRRCRHKRYEQTESAKVRRLVYMRWWYAVNEGKKWASIPERKRPTFEQWKHHDEPTPAKWLAIVQRQKKGA